MFYETAEKVQIVKWYYQGQSRRQIKVSFNEVFVDRPVPSLSTIHNIINNFELHGCVDYKRHKKSLPANEARDERNVMICALATNNPVLTTSQIAAEVDSTPSTVRAVLKKKTGTNHTGFGKLMKFLRRTISEGWNFVIN